MWKGRYQNQNKDISDLKTLTFREKDNVYEVVQGIIDNLPPKALQELAGGGEADLERLIDDLVKTTEEIVNQNKSELKLFDNLEAFEASVDESLKIQSYNYFKTTMLPNFNQGWRNVEMGNLFQLYHWSAYLASRSSGKSYEACFAFPLWRIWRYNAPQPFIRDTLDNRNSKETVIITNESTLGKQHLAKIVTEIRTNDLLAQKINTNKKSSLGRESLETETGSLIRLRSFNSSGIRGQHVGAVMVDDFLDKSALYSVEQRKKFKEVFYGEIISIVEPGGYLIVTGTPFHFEDLYTDLKKDPEFKVFEYPAIFPDGRLLAPDRLSYEEIMKKRRSLGTLVFSREILVSPISDSSSIFPWEYLKRSFNGMENVGYVYDIHSYPIKLERVVIGCDFAISGNISADFSVFSVWGIDKNENYYLLHIWRKKGASHNEQVNKIVQLRDSFEANEIVAENNGFQRILIEMVKERGIQNIKEFTTTSNIKKDLYEGLPSLSAIFERGEIRMPYRSEEDKELSNMICGEFNSITFDEDKGTLASSAGHDDTVMSSFMAITELRQNKSSFKIDLI